MLKLYILITQKFYIPGVMHFDICFLCDFQKKFAAMIRQAGFEMVTYENLTFGVSAIHSGYKLLKVVK